MKQTTTFFDAFEKKRNQFYSLRLDEYRNKIDLARDEAKGEIHSQFLGTLYTDYQQQQLKLNKFSRFLIDINELLKANKNETFQSLFNAHILEVPKKEVADLVDDLAELDAIDNVISEIRQKTKEYLTESEIETSTAKTGLQWKGGELEFVQLIYSLYHAKYLSNDEDKITHLIQQVAKVFNHKLGKNWQINLSESVNKRNTDYEPKIFQKIKTAYSEYCEKQIENNKQKKPK